MPGSNMKAAMKATRPYALTMPPTGKANANSISRMPKLASASIREDLKSRVEQFLLEASVLTGAVRWVPKAGSKKFGTVLPKLSARGKNVLRQTKNPKQREYLQRIAAVAEAYNPIERAVQRVQKSSRKFNPVHRYNRKKHDIGAKVSKFLSTPNRVTQKYLGDG